MGKRKAGKATRQYQEPSPTRRRDGVPPALVGIATFIAFLPALWNGFVWDDLSNLVNNLNYRGMGWNELRWMFSTFRLGHYQPLSWVTFGLDYLLWGMDPFGYHLTNLLLHTANAVVFYFIALRLLSLVFSHSRDGENAQLRIASVTAALFFAIHPLRVESVAWLTERRDVLSALLALCTVLFYLRAASALNRVSRWRCLGLAVGFYGLSLFSKATGITLPAVLLILDIYPLRRLGQGRGKWFGVEVRDVWWEKVPFVILAIPFSVLALMAQREAGALKLLRQYGVGARMAQAFFGIAFYLWKSVLPIRLSPLYELSDSFRPSDWPFVLSGLVVLALTIVLFVYRRRRPGALACWVCYIIVVSPVLGIAQSGIQLVADRYTYLSCLSWAVMAGAGICLGWNRLAAGRVTHNAFVAGAGLVASVLLVLGGLTWHQCGIWHDTEGLWSYAALVAPESDIVHYNLGLTLEKRGDFEGAVQNYRQALKTNPASSDVNYNLAGLLARGGESEEAIRHYQRALETEPNAPDAQNNLGELLMRRGELVQATQHFQQAIAINPKYAKAFNNLGAALSQQGDVDGAIQDYRKALQVDPANAVTYYNLGILFAQQGRLGEAVDQFQRGIAVAPNDAEMHFCLGNVLFKEGFLNQATDQFHDTLRINPSHVKASYYLAAILAQRGDLEGAAQEFEKVLRLDPDLAEAHDAIARVLMLQGKKEEALPHSQEALRLLNSRGKKGGVP